MPRPAIWTVVNDENACDVTAAKAGDHEAFGRIHGRHAAVVLSLCRRASASLTDAEDATQETFIRAFNMLDKFDSSSSSQGFRSWIYAIARRVCSERRRASSRRAWREEQAMKHAAPTLDATAMEPASEQCRQREQLERLTAALDQLDERERLAVHLHYLETDPVKAAEMALGLTRSGYYKLLARARDRLAALMSAHEFTSRRIKA